MITLESEVKNELNILKIAGVGLTTNRKTTVIQMTLPVFCTWGIVQSY